MNFDSDYFIFAVMQYVMIVLKGSVPMKFGGSQDPAVYGELVSIGCLGVEENKKLSAGISSVCEAKLSVPKSRCFLKFYEAKVNPSLQLIVLVVSSSRCSLQQN